ILLDTDHTDGFEQYDTEIYNRKAGIAPPPGKLFSVVTSSYIAQFASSAGVAMKDETGAHISTLGDAILHWSDSREVKQLESFLIFLKATAPLSPVYDTSAAGFSTRLACVGGC